MHNEGLDKWLKYKQINTTWNILCTNSKIFRKLKKRQHQRKTKWFQEGRVWLRKSPRILHTHTSKRVYAKFSLKTEYRNLITHTVVDCNATTQTAQRFRDGFETTSEETMNAKDKQKKKKLVSRGSTCVWIMKQQSIVLSCCSALPQKKNVKWAQVHHDMMSDGHGSASHCYTHDCLERACMQDTFVCKNAGHVNVRIL
jgi:hypothetical protein